MDYLTLVLGASLVWLAVCAVILYASATRRWGTPHSLIIPMAASLMVAFIAYIVLAASSEALLMEAAYRISDTIGYAFVLLALVMTIDYSRRPKGWERKHLMVLYVITAVVLLISLINPFNLYVNEYQIVDLGYTFVDPQMGGLAAALILFSLICSLFTIILPFQAFTETRGRYHETLTLLSAGGFVLLLGAFYMNFDIMAGDPAFATLSLFAVFLVIAFMASLRLNIYIYEPDIKDLSLDTLYDAILAVDPEGRLAYANETAERIFSTCFESMRGRPVDDYIPWTCLERLGGDKDPDMVRLVDGDREKTYNIIRFPLRNGSSDLGIAYLLRDITDVIHYHESVSIALEKLELLNSISRHDMLNHLTIIHGYTELAQMVCDEDKCSNYLKKIIDGCVNAEGVVNFNRAYKGLGLTLDWIPLREVVEKAIQEADVGGLLTTEVSSDDVEVFADSLISRAIYNIIHNGRVHAEGATKIRVTMGWEPSGDEYRVVIEDDGCGIPAEEKELIFRNGYGKTSGFGLFLTKEILDISKARIWEEGADGARFVISFPKSNVRRRTRDSIN